MAKKKKSVNKVIGTHIGRRSPPENGRSVQRVTETIKNTKTGKVKIRKTTRTI